MTSGLPVFKILPTTQQYDWGKLGKDSKVAEFAKGSEIPGFNVDENAPYAELWMGTHPSSPSKVKGTGETLSQHLAAHPNLIGTPIIQKFNAENGNLPFLLKILSIRKALSIQSHPDKATAELLHSTQPDIYKDPNHKPEMALAITPFTALCGFRPLREIAELLQLLPEFKDLFSVELVEEFTRLSASDTPQGPKEKEILKTLFDVLMNTPPEIVRQRLPSLISRFKNTPPHERQGYDTIANMMILLDEQFPGDIGVYCPIVLNIVQLEPGQAIFLGANEPHAYVSGECVECMANSDNVIRAGLTPKFRDVPNLVSGLTYVSSPSSRHNVKSTPFREPSTAASLLYDPPITEFSVVRVGLDQAGTEKHPALEGPSIAIVTGGGGRLAFGENDLSLGNGEVIFIGAGSAVEFTAGSEGLTVYRAFVEA
ncbi:mannose-6-phosphate isomerase [Panaeolus papilionaceus]|nr:mannose-6-phosphate isomerase [Panaeolus papilionaceus]